MYISWFHGVYIQHNSLSQLKGDKPDFIVLLPTWLDVVDKSRLRSQKEEILCLAGVVLRTYQHV